MADSFKKRGQKFIKRFSRASFKAGVEGKEHIKENLIMRFSHIQNVRLLVLEWGLLVVALIMLSIAQAFWFGDSYAENVFTMGGTYTEATIGEVDSLNPIFAVTNSERVLSKLMFATVSTIDYSGHVGVGLAKSIWPEEDGKVWKVKVRNDLKWSDGEPITNEDVLFTAQLIKNPSVNSIYSSNFTKVEISLDEDDNVVFRLPTVYADFESALNFPVVPKHVLAEADPKTLVEHNFSINPVTSGAFTLNAVQTGTGKEKTYYLSSNPNYFKGKTMLNSFAVHTYDSRDKIIEAMNGGSVTATAEISGPDADKISTAKFIRKNSSINSGAFMFFNMTSEAVKNAALRAAIREGLNLETIRAAAPDTAKLDYPLLKSQITLTNYPAIPAHNFDAAKSKIAEIAGEHQISLELATINSGYLVNVTNVIKEQLEALGFSVNLSVYEESQDFISNVISRRGYDILVYEVELGADPDLLPYYHSSQVTASGLNLSNYKNRMVDDLLLGGRETLNQELRVKKYESFLQYFVNEVPAIALYQPNLTYIYNKNVRTYGNDVRLVTAIDRFSDISNWAVNKTTKNKTP